MTKTEFAQKLNCNVEYYEAYKYGRRIPHAIGEYDYMEVPRIGRIEIMPSHYGPEYRQAIFTVATLPSRTASPWSKANYDAILDRIAPYRVLWYKQASAYRKTPEYRESRRRRDVIGLAERSGLANDNHHGSTRGDWFYITICDYAWRKSDLRKYNASGKYLAVVCQSRKRVYAKSSKWFPRITDFYFVVGENENGNPFHHAVPNTIQSLPDAMDWIWSGAKIEARQGDVGIAASTLKHVEGDDGDIDVMGGHSRHRFIGEIYRNGSVHVRNGFLYHTGDQHPTIYLDGSKWRRIVIARRSERTASSAD